MSKLIVPLGLIVGSIAIIVVLILPAWQHFLAVRADSKHLEDISAEIDMLTQKRDAITQQISAITKENFQRLDQIIPSGAAGPEFLIMLQQLALSHNLRMGRLNLAGTLSTKSRIPVANNTSSGTSGTGDQQGNYQTISASLELSGQYQAFKDFLHDLESNTRITDIDTLNFIPSANGFDFKLTVKTYYQ